MCDSGIRCDGDDSKLKFYGRNGGESNIRRREDGEMLGVGGEGGGMGWKRERLMLDGRSYS